MGKSDGWFAGVAHRREWHPWRRDLERMAELLQISVEDLRACAGGSREEHYATDEWRLRVQCLRLAEAADRAANNKGAFVHAVHAVGRGDMAALAGLRDDLLKLPRRAHENFRKGAAKRKGAKRSEETRDAIGAAHKRQWEGFTQEERDRRIAAASTDESRAVCSVASYLRWHPDAPPDELRRHMERVAKRLGHRRGFVEWAWREHQRRRGRASRAGRRADARPNWCRAIHEEMAASGWDGMGRAPWGFDRRVEARLRKNGSADDATYDAVAQFRKRHLPICDHHWHPSRTHGPTRN